MIITKTTKHSLLVILLVLSPVFSLAADHYMATSRLNARTGAGTGYAISFVLEKGDEVELLSQTGHWYKIRFSDNTGYVYSEYLKPAKKNKIIENNEILGVSLLLILIGLVFSFGYYLS